MHHCLCSHLPVKGSGAQRTMAVALAQALGTKGVIHSVDGRRSVYRQIVRAQAVEVPRFNGTADNGSGSARCGAMDDDGSGSARCGAMGDGRCSGRRHGRRAVQRAAARTTGGAAGGGTDDGRCSGRRHGRRHRAEDEHAAHTGARGKRRLRRLRGKQRQRFWLQRLRGEARQTLGGEHPYLCNLSPLPATHSHALLHAQAPCGYHRPPSTPELHMALDMVPDGPPPTPIPARGRIRQATIQRLATIHTPALFALRHTPPRRLCRLAIPARPAVVVERGRWLTACHSFWRWRVMRGDRP